MPRRSILSASERENLMALPEEQDHQIQHYSFTASDLSLVRQRRGDANRIGFAVQLCLLRYPGYALASDMPVPDPVIQWIALQIRSDAAAWSQYGARNETRREHFQEPRAYLSLSAFGLPDFRKLVLRLADLTMQTDKGLVLAAQALDTSRQRRIILSALAVIERACAEAVTRANRRIYQALLEPLQPHHLRGLDNLLNVAPDLNSTWLVWLHQSPLRPNSRYVREHIERLKIFQSLALPDGIGRQIHQNRLLKMAREGAQMTPRHLFAVNWGDGSTSSSDGQRFRAGGRAESTGHINPKYGAEPEKMVYTHISDTYAPFSTKMVNVGMRDSTYVLDGLLYHESDLRIEEHYTDTAGFTDHVFALMHMLGFRFTPRIRDLGDTKRYIPGTVQEYPGLKAMIGGTLNLKHVRAHWDDILRLASSIKHGTVTASLMLRKLGSYPRQNRKRKILHRPVWLHLVGHRY